MAEFLVQTVDGKLHIYEVDTITLCEIAFTHLNDRPVFNLTQKPKCMTCRSASVDNGSIMYKRRGEVLIAEDPES